MEDMFIPSGGHFGERALLLGAPRAANVEADSEEVRGGAACACVCVAGALRRAHAGGAGPRTASQVMCYVLARKEFNELLGPLKILTVSYTHLTLPTNREV